METTTGITDPTERAALENELDFKYRTDTGKLIFAMVACCVDISFLVHKFTQFKVVLYHP